MKVFLVKCLVFSFFPLLSALAVFYLENGNADAFAMRFTTGKKTSLILGNSRAAQGLIPQEIERELQKKWARGLYNYAFAIGYSAYGPVYFKSVLDKLDPNTEEGLFIVTVDPWALVESKDSPNDPSVFSELDSPLAEVYNQGFKPNLSYMLNWFDKPYYEIIHRTFRPANQRLHRESGWLELVLPMDAATVDFRIGEKKQQFEEGYRSVTLSSLRLTYLEKTISVLKEHGKVFLVYLPAHPDIMRFDCLIVPEFERIMENLAIKYDVPYKDYSDIAGELVYIDGIHLHQSSGRKLSAELGRWIQKIIDSGRRNE